MIAFRAVEDIQPNTVLEWDYTCISTARRRLQRCVSRPRLCAGNVNVLPPGPPPPHHSRLTNTCTTVNKLA